LAGPMTVASAVVRGISFNGIFRPADSSRTEYAL
jgi:hypothetical protein